IFSILSAYIGPRDLYVLLPLPGIDARDDRIGELRVRECNGEGRITEDSRRYLAVLRMGNSSAVKLRGPGTARVHEVQGVASYAGDLIKFALNHDICRGTQLRGVID